jgi:hypothetical protein
MMLPRLSALTLVPEGDRMVRLRSEKLDIDMVD